MERTWECKFVKLYIHLNIFMSWLKQIKILFDDFWYNSIVCHLINYTVSYISLTKQLILRDCFNYITLKNGTETLSFQAWIQTLWKSNSFFILGQYTEKHNIS